MLNAGRQLTNSLAAGSYSFRAYYNGDVHNPRKRANQKDVNMRMQQFFANKLKGAPPPDWMVKGIPFLEKGRDQIVPPKITPNSPDADRR